MPSYLYEVKINKYNSLDKMETIHLIAGNIGEAINIANFYVYEEERYPNTPVEIVSVCKEVHVVEILNSFATGIQEDPFNLGSNPSDLEIIRFKHSCSNIIEVLDNGWDEIKCPDCKEAIDRRDVENVGGVWLYVGADKGN